MRTLLCLALAWAALAFGQAYPSRPITLIIPFPPGGSTDIVGRMAAHGLARELGQPLVVDNRGGGGGAIGAKAIAEAAPDGYTLGIATVSTHVVNPVVRADLRYDPLKDFTLLSEIAAVPNVVSIHPSLPARNMAEFVAYAGRIRASSITAHPASAASAISSARRSSTRPESISPTCPTAAPARR